MMTNRNMYKYSGSTRKKHADEFDPVKLGLPVNCKTISQQALRGPIGIPTTQQS